MSLVWIFYEMQKQPSIGVLMKRCSENIQQIDKRTPMPKCDFNKVAKQLCWNHISACVLSCQFAAYFQNNFSKEHLWRAASGNALVLEETVVGVLSHFLRSSYPEVFCKIDFLKDFFKFRGKHLCQSLFFN